MPPWHPLERGQKGGSGSPRSGWVGPLGLGQRDGRERIPASSAKSRGETF